MACFAGGKAGQETPEEHGMARITVEDALAQINNRFVIAEMAIKRVKMYREGYPQLLETNNSEVVTAIREIAAGKVRLRSPIKEAGIKVEES
jgi:DNA-directed RNA polymerase subunit omega